MSDLSEKQISESQIQSESNSVSRENSDSQLGEDKENRVSEASTNQFELTLNLQGGEFWTSFENLLDSQVASQAASHLSEEDEGYEIEILDLPQEDFLANCLDEMNQETPFEEQTQEHEDVFEETPTQQCDKKVQIVPAAPTVKSDRLSSSSSENTPVKLSVIICPFCEEILTNYRDLSLHLLSFHKMETPYKCNICFEFFLDVYHLEQHIKTKHLRFAATFNCGKCQKSFKFKPHFDRHLNTHLGNPLFTCSCDLCGFISSDFDRMRCHLTGHLEKGGNSGNPGISTSASLLPLSTPNSNGEAKRVEAQTEGRIMIYKCNTCEKVFFRKENLFDHIKSQHSEITFSVVAFKCKFCGLLFESVPALDSHMQNTHIIPSVCEICQESFPSKDELEVHRKIHFKLKNDDGEIHQDPMEVRLDISEKKY